MTSITRTAVSLFAATILSLGLVACGGGGDGADDGPVPEPSESQATGTVEVTVDLDGEAPEQELLDLSGNDECGMDERRDQQVVQNENGTLRYSVVAVSGGPDDLGTNQDAESPTIDQEGCMYTPRVVTARTGQTVTIADSDPNMHNVRATNPDGSSAFNMSTYEGDSMDESFDQAGVFSLQCDVHPWMQGYVYVTEHGYADVTGEEGNSSLELPVGDYTLEVWHEEYGTQEIEVSVEEDSTVTETVTFS